LIFDIEPLYINRSIFYIRNNNNDFNVYQSNKNLKKDGLNVVVLCNNPKSGYTLLFIVEQILSNNRSNLSLENIIKETLICSGPLATPTIDCATFEHALAMLEHKGGENSGDIPLKVYSRSVYGNDIWTYEKVLKEMSNFISANNLFL
jgi:hypothetical protein